MPFHRLAERRLALVGFIKSSELRTMGGTDLVDVCKTGIFHGRGEIWGKRSLPMRSHRS